MAGRVRVYLGMPRGVPGGVLGVGPAVGIGPSGRSGGPLGRSGGPLGRSGGPSGGPSGSSESFLEVLLAVLSPF